ncbi:MAG: hypothetical protein NZO16_07250, partial [Deltaproteobacteria bacterium]|nr:hypothetical protein [Deltaproteobacteria bacterium]
AKEGDVLMADILRNLAVRYAKEIGVKLTKEQERALNAACKEARRNGINVAIKKAQSMAKEGDVYLVEFYKDQAVKFANEIGVELTKEQEKALNAACKEARRIGINLAIKKAISFANDGNVDSADFMINTAKRYADEIGVKLTKEQEKTLNEAYRNARQNGIREYIKITLKHAIDGNEASVRFFSERVKVWAQELGRELSPREERALTQAQTILKERVVPVTMDAIRRYAKNGEVTLVDLLSNRVLENIKNLKDSDVREIREELDKLKTFVRRQAIPKLIDEVRYWAEKNEKFMVDRIVTSILEYSKEAHYSLSPEERESLITAIKKAGTVMPKELKEKN